jgi:hypothetical protein
MVPKLPFGAFDADCEPGSGALLRADVESLRRDSAGGAVRRFVVLRGRGDSTATESAGGVLRATGGAGFDGVAAGEAGAAGVPGAGVIKPSDSVTVPGVALAGAAAGSTAGVARAGAGCPARTARNPPSPAAARHPMVNAAKTSLLIPMC